VVGVITAPLTAPSLVFQAIPSGLIFCDNGAFLEQSFRRSLWKEWYYNAIGVSGWNVKAIA